MLQHPRCPLCHGPTRPYVSGTISPSAFFDTENTYRIAEGAGPARLDIYRCDQCGHGFTPLDIGPDVIEKWYATRAPDTVYLQDLPARKRTAQRILAEVERLHGTRGDLFDIGAGPGIFLSEAVKRGWHVRGVESASWAVKYGQASLGVSTLRQATIASLASEASDSVDVITALDVIEHLVDPEFLVQEVSRILRPRGVLVLTTPRFDSTLARVMGSRWYCIFPAHIHLFTKTSLSTLLGKFHLTPVVDRSHTRYLSLPYLWYRLRTFLGQKADPPPEKTRAGPALPVNFGDEFELYARKRS